MLDFDIDIRGFLFKILFKIIIFWKISEENLKNWSGDISFADFLYLFF